MIKKALENDGVVDCTNFYDHFFISKAKRNVKTTTAHWPYFDGAYWIDAVEDLIKIIEEWSGGGSGKMLTQQISWRVLKSMGHTYFLDNERKDVMVMKEVDFLENCLSYCH